MWLPSSDPRYPLHFAGGIVRGDSTPGRRVKSCGRRRPPLARSMKRGRKGVPLINNAMRILIMASRPRPRTATLDFITNMEHNLPSQTFSLSGQSFEFPPFSLISSSSPWWWRRRWLVLQSLSIIVQQHFALSNLTVRPSDGQWIGRCATGNVLEN